jgi:hypothetical protein
MIIFLFAGYTYIVDNIQGYKIISPEYQREYVRKLIPKIGKMITPCKVLPHLRRKGLVARCDMEEIEKISAICSNYAGAKHLLENLLENQTHHNWYVLFIEALQEAGMNEVAMDLEIPALLPGSAQNFTDTGKFTVILTVLIIVFKTVKELHFFLHTCVNF